MKNEVLAYTAGLIDGEGSIGINVGKRYIDDHTLWVQMSNTDEGIINWMKDIFGGNFCVCSNENKTCWSWKIHSIQAKDFLKMIYPYLKIKQKQAELAIEFQENKIDLRGKEKDFKTQEIIHREEYKQKIMQLNRGDI